MTKIEKTVTASTILAAVGLLTLVSGTAFAQVEGQAVSGGGIAAGPAPGQQPPGAEAGVAGGVEASISSTTLTWRSHSIGAGVAAGNLEGNACPATFKMVSGACHPGYNDRMTIINQFPNIPANTWRCGFKNNTGAAATAWIYTLCAK